MSSTTALLDKCVKRGTKLSGRQAYLADSNPINFHCWVISRFEDKDRFERSKHILTELKMDPIRFVGVEGRKTPRLPAYSKLSDGEWGCLLSHQSIWMLAARHPNENQYTAVFEDDIVTPLMGNALLEQFDRLQQVLVKRRNTDLVFLGKCHEYCQILTHVSDNVYEANRPMCLHSYLIHNKFARQLMLKPILQKSLLEASNAYNLNHPAFENLAVDAGLVKLINSKQCNALVYHPALFFQDVLQTSSNLRNRKEQFGMYSECQELLDHNNARHGLFAAGLVVFTIVLCYIFYLYRNIRSNNRNNED